MPNTSTYGFDYESPTSLPGTTLTSGPTSDMPVLAVQVDAALASLASTVSDQATTIATMQSTITTMQSDITNLTNWTRRGSITVNFTTVNTYTTSVSFGYTFPTAPTVSTNIDSSSGTTTRWLSRAINRTTTGFTLWVVSADSATATWSDVPVTWVAHYRA